MRLTSFGDFNGKGWESANAYESYIIENYGFNYLVALACRLAEVGEEHRLDVKSFTNDYLLPYFISMSESNHTVQGSDVGFSGTHNGEYYVYYYVYTGDFSGLNVDLGELDEVEALYRAYVESQYLYVDDVTKDFVTKIIESQGWSKDDPDIISKVQQYVQNCATYNLKYNRDLDKEDNIVVAFLGDKYNEGVCRHYASAATVIYRVLGIPARYTIGYVGQTVENEWTNIKSNTGHAWTEVYINGIGWIPVEVTGSGFDDGSGDDFGDPSDQKVLIELTPNNVSKEYDGTPLLPDGFSITGGNLKDGHSIVIDEVVITGSQTEVGQSESNIVLETVRIVDEDGNDVTSEYWIDLCPGKLIVTKRSITIITGSEVKEYDGTPLTSDKVEIFGLLEGHNVTIKLTGSQTEIGESDNTVLDGSIKILDEDGNDVSANYNITLHLGTLTVTKRMLTINTGSAKKEYDGTPLTSDKVEISGLLEGHELTVTLTGSQTEIGESDNTVLDGSVRILDKYGNDVSDVYDISYILGKLTVVEKLEGGEDGEDGEGEGGSGGSGGGGSGGSGGGGTGGNLDTSGNIKGDGMPGGSDYDPGPPRVVLQVKSTTTGTIYMRLMSYGDYTGTGWAQANAYESYIIENYGFNYLVALTIRLADVAQEHKLDVKSFTSDYLLPYFISMSEGNYVIQGNDVAFSGTHNGEYSLYYYTYNGDLSALQVDLGTLSEVERLYREFVYAQYLTIDSVTNEFIQDLIKEQGWSKNDPDILRKVQKYVQNCATYNMMYDPNLDLEENIVVAFLGDDYNEGLCRHYASAATMIFRALGIPARYTIGYVGYTVAGQWTDVTSDSGHAWTEVYLDGIGWIPLEVTGAGADGNVGDGDGEYGGSGDADGDLDIDEALKEVEIAPTDVSKAYDGTPLYAENEIKVPYNSVIYKLIQLGYTYEVVVEGSQTEIGIGESTIVSFKLFAPDGTNVTDKFTITYLPGEVRVTKTQVVIVLYEIQKTYDGTPLSYQPDDYWIEDIPKGYTLEFILVGSMTEAGEFDISQLRDLPYIIRNERGEDVTDSYHLEIEGVGLIINTRHIEICSASAQREYNGEALTDDTVTITFGSLVRGHQLICTVTGSITDVGTTENEIEEYIIIDENGNDVTDSYDVKAIFGTLEIVKGSNV